jgi:signal transduction histidine kinase
VDAFLTAVLQSAPSWGVGGLLITYIVILIRREARVDESHLSALNHQAQLHATELERVNKAHDDEITELTEKIRQLRSDLNDLDEHLSTERANRLGLPPRPRRIGATIDQDVLDGTERIDP